MSRILTVGAAQMGPIQRADTRSAAWSRSCSRPPAMAVILLPFLN